MSLSDALLLTLILLAALGCGLMGGLFFAFSNFVMHALGRLSPANGIAAMQSINLMVLNPLFLSVFMGTSVACLLLIVYALVRWSAPGTLLLTAGSGLFLLGNFVVTMLCNVPRNELLARVEVDSDEAQGLWQEYLRDWTRWNHVRTVTALGAAALLILAVR
ncbi:DUF1772 domain-containing protein [Pseudomonas sp. R5(2019)]|uniref:anthrone oxygenase family protein n=1 Tax=Pseudomonas sp. R5(2019) TaxID=2697566 RepID=UPI001412CA3A|nr:anthrone oxygenase family protein [Pseudomonas sp. R5(2019)]NBA95584.1 DUF1772 domain-containing protein [Pseudomonas sp. R5(2019)]